MIKVLIVDDNENIRKLVSAFLAQKGYEPFCAKDGLEALQKMDHMYFDLILVDIMMPNLDGFDLTKDIRQVDEQIPILMITAKDTLEDKQKAYHCGIDDYITKPVDLDELELRIKALLRRAKIFSDKKITMGDVTMDYETRTIMTTKEEMELPRKEFDLLYKLMSYPKKIFTRRQLMDEIWGMDSEADERTVDVHIKRLRQKFDGYDAFEIVTVRGLGYKVERSENGHGECKE